MSTLLSSHSMICSKRKAICSQPSKICFEPPFLISWIGVWISLLPTFSAIHPLSKDVILITAPFCCATKLSHPSFSAFSINTYQKPYWYLSISVIRKAFQPFFPPTDCTVSQPMNHSDSLSFYALQPFLDNYALFPSTPFSNFNFFLLIFLPSFYNCLAIRSIHVYSS